MGGAKFRYFLEISTKISEESPLREFFTDMVIDRCVSKTNLITLFLCFTLKPEPGMELPKTQDRDGHFM